MAIDTTSHLCSLYSVEERKLPWFSVGYALKRTSISGVCGKGESVRNGILLVIANVDMPLRELLFSPALISTEAQRRLPPNYLLRPLASTDFDLGFVHCLGHLTQVQPDKDAFLSRFAYVLQHNHEYFILVVVELDPATKEERRIVGSGTVFCERKFIRGNGIVGHIEDIVVHKDARGLKLGWIIIEALKHVGNQVGCYKVILDCEEHNVKFYEKCGFMRKEVEMVWYVPGKDARASKL